MKNAKTQITEAKIEEIKRVLDAVKNGQPVHGRDCQRFEEYTLKLLADRGADVEGTSFYHCSSSEELDNLDPNCESKEVCVVNFCASRLGSVLSFYEDGSLGELTEDKHDEIDDDLASVGLTIFVLKNGDIAYGENIKHSGLRCVRKLSSVFQEERHVQEEISSLSKKMESMEKRMESLNCQVGDEIMGFVGFKVGEDVEFNGKKFKLTKPTVMSFPSENGSIRGYLFVIQFNGKQYVGDILSDREQNISSAKVCFNPNSVIWLNGGERIEKCE